MRKIDAIFEKRKEDRLSRAQSCVECIRERSKHLDVDFKIVGSMKRGDFKKHSDVDILVLNTIDSRLRLEFDKLVYTCADEHDIPCDLIYSQEISKESAEELLND